MPHRPEPIGDLETLLPEVKNSNSKALLSEAIAAYKAGAYRSSVMTTWVAIVVDLLEKCKEVQEENKKAKKIHKDFTNLLDIINKTRDQDKINDAIRDIVNLEQTILESAKDELEFISEGELFELRRIREARHLCAHPSISELTLKPYYPRGEMCRAYIIDAWDFVLRHPPTLGKKHAKAIVENISEPNFPKDLKQAIQILSSNYHLAKLKQTAFRGVIDLLIKNSLNEEENTENRQRYLTALCACEKIRGNEFHNEFPELFNKTAPTKARQLHWGAELLGRLETTYEKLDNSLLLRIKETITHILFNKQDEWHNFQNITLACKYPGIEDAFFEFISLGRDHNSKVNREIIFKALQNFKQHPKLCDEYIKFFCDSSSFYYTNDAVLPLQKYAPLFTAENLKNILNGSLQHCDNTYHQIWDSGHGPKILHILQEHCKYPNVWKSFREKLDKIKKEVDDLYPSEEARRSNLDREKNTRYNVAEYILKLLDETAPENEDQAKDTQPPTP